jgi:hypothetical protein
MVREALIVEKNLNSTKGTLDWVRKVQKIQQLFKNKIIRINQKL